MRHDVRSIMLASVFIVCGFSCQGVFLFALYWRLEAGKALKVCGFILNLKLHVGRPHNPEGRKEGSPQVGHSHSQGGAPRKEKKERLERCPQRGRSQGGPPRKGNEGTKRTMPTNV